MGRARSPWAAVSPSYFFNAFKWPYELWTAKNQALMRHIFSIGCLFCWIISSGGCASTEKRPSISTQHPRASIVGSQDVRGRGLPSKQKRFSPLPWRIPQKKNEVGTLPSSPVTLATRDRDQEADLQSQRHMQRASNLEEDRVPGAAPPPVRHISWDVQLKELYSPPIETSRLPLPTAVR